MLIKSYEKPFYCLLNFLIFVMMETGKYIQELLYRYNCVVVPDFGAFLSCTGQPIPLIRRPRYCPLMNSLPPMTACLFPIWPMRKTCLMRIN